MDSEQRSKIFLEELKRIEHAGFMSLTAHQNIIRAYNELRSREPQQQYVYTNKEEAEKSQPAQALHPPPTQAAMAYVQKQTLAQPPVKAPIPAPVNEAVLRERRITWALILGVIMVLLSGLILATTNWDLMTPLGKTILIGLVGVLFFGISVIAERLLKINKTAHAFWLLGNLFLPVTILSVGFYQLLGYWLSIQGEGRYVFGLVASLVCLPVYLYSTKKYQTKLFSWLTMITTSVGVGFLIASFKGSRDVFFLLTTVYNFLLVLIHIKFNFWKKIPALAKVYPLFLQINLAISLLFMLFIFESNSFYGINLILLSFVIYYFMWDNNKVAYAFVFSGLFTCGIYNVVSYTFLASFEPLLYSLIGLVFFALAASKYENKNFSRAFNYISAFVSVLVFLYVTIFRFRPYLGENSLLLFLSYSLISINSFLLDNRLKNKVFAFIAPLYLILAFESLIKFDLILGSLYIYPAYMFLTGLIIYLGLYVFNRVKILQTIKPGVAVFTYLTVLYALIHALGKDYWVLDSLILLSLGLIHYINHRISKDKTIKALNAWMMPFAFFFAVFVFYGYMERVFDLSKYSLLTHAGLAAIAINLLAHLWNKLDKALESSFKWVSHGIIALLSLVFWLMYAFATYKIPYVFYGFLVAYLLSLLRSKKEWEIKLFLYSGFTSLYLSLHMSFKAISSLNQYAHFTLFITGAFVALLWALLRDSWRKRVTWYLVPFLYVSLLYFMPYVAKSWLEFLIFCFYTALALLIGHRAKLQVLNAIPLVIFFAKIHIIYDTFLGYQKFYPLFVWLAVGLLLRLLGFVCYKKLWEKNSAGSSKNLLNFAIDWYTLFSLLAFIAGIYVLPEQGNLFFLVLPHLFFSLWFLSNIYRFENPKSKKIFTTMAALSLLVPYYRLLGQIAVPEIIRTELFCLPWLLLTIYLTHFTWKNYKNITSKLELAALLIISAVLLLDIIILNNIGDALILGAVSLAAIIVGMGLKTKSYFFVGIGNTLATVLSQTRYFWLSVPWWVYLLSVGLVLIIIASVFEIKKNRDDKKLTLIMIDFLKKKFANWR